FMAQEVKYLSARQADDDGCSLAQGVAYLRLSLTQFQVGLVLAGQLTTAQQSLYPIHYSGCSSE
ncbi:MAG TPA: hypothetical protein V6C50_12120, partial [Crinalium sp.]